MWSFFRSPLVVFSMLLIPKFFALVCQNSVAWFLLWPRVSPFSNCLDPVAFSYLRILAIESLNCDSFLSLIVFPSFPTASIGFGCFRLPSKLIGKLLPSFRFVAIANVI